MTSLLNKISKLNEQHKAAGISKEVIESFTQIVLATVKLEAEFNYKHFTNAAIGACKKFDARNCKTDLGVIGTINEFQNFNKNGLVLATDDSGWRFELTPLGATITKLVLNSID